MSLDIMTEETQRLIDRVLSVAEKIKPLHAKLTKIVEDNRTDILTLKALFQVKQGSPGRPLRIQGEDFYWSRFVGIFFGTTTHRLNQLLGGDAGEEVMLPPRKKNQPPPPKPPMENLHYKHGHREGYNQAMRESTGGLETLRVTPEVTELAEQVAELEEQNTNLLDRLSATTCPKCGAPLERYP